MNIGGQPGTCIKGINHVYRLSAKYMYIGVSLAHVYRRSAKHMYIGVSLAHVYRRSAKSTYIGCQHSTCI